MSLMFYPNLEDVEKGTLEARTEVLMEAAERYRAVVLDEANKVTEVKYMLPRELKVAYNWDEIAHVLREVRELTEANKQAKARKAALLNKLAEVYEVLRAAKMPKLEAVRIALASEVTQLSA